MIRHFEYVMHRISRTLFRQNFGSDLSSPFNQPNLSMKINNRLIVPYTVSLSAFAVVMLLCSQKASAQTDTKKIVRVFILAGQSNMVGMGRVAMDPAVNEGKGTLGYLVKNPETASKYANLVNADGSWKIRNDVMTYFKREEDIKSGGLTVGFGGGDNSIGPELEFGTVVGDAITAPVLLIKQAWGGKSLCVDFRPPSSGRKLGEFYTATVNGTKDVMKNFKTLYPQWKEYTPQIAGFGWFQGWNDRCDDGTASREYEVNMVNFIKDIRKDLALPNMPFVIGECGLCGPNETNPNALLVMKAQKAAAEKPVFKGNVAFVGTVNFYREPSESPTTEWHHWHQNAESYCLVGEGMGHAMLKLLAPKK